jgi:HEAT repeat protein
MTPKLLRWRLRPRELLLLAALAAILGYLLIPTRSARSSDPTGRHLDTLRTGSIDEREAAATALARLASTDAARIIPALIQAATDRDARVRNAAVDALHVVDPKDPSANGAIDALITALADPDARVRATAAGVLSTVRPAPKSAIPALVEAANSRTPTRNGEPAPGSTAAGPMSAQQSIERSQRDHARASAVAALGVIGKDDAQAQQALVSLAGDDTPEVRMVVARTLGELDAATPGALEAELKLAADPDVYIQARAVTALGHFPGHDITTCPILYRAYRSKLRPLQEGAELALQKIVASATFDALRAWRSKDPSVRFAAVFGQDPGSEQGLQALLKALKDDDPGVRVLAVTRLGCAPPKSASLALKALESLADDPDADVQIQLSFARKSLRTSRTNTALR